MVYYNLNSYNETMLMVGLIKWWYTDGLRSRYRSLDHWLLRTVDFFSLSLLIKTLFNPFRQISASMLPPSVPITTRFQSAGDRMFSRFFGFTIRTIMLVVGSVVIFAQIVFSIVLLIFWFIMPLSIVLGSMMTVLEVI